MKTLPSPRCNPIRIYKFYPNNPNLRIPLFGYFGSFGCHSAHSDRVKGFSLIEIIIAVTIASLITIVLGEMIIQGYRNYRVTAEQTTYIALARRTQDTIVRELRDAIVSDAGDYPLIRAEANRLEFYSDVDRDSARERVRYWRENNLLKRGLTEPTGDPAVYRDADETVRTITQYLTGTDPVFRYYKSDGTELTSPLDLTSVTLVGVNFTIDAAPGELPRGTTVNTTVQLRNVKANLEE
ncbi:prepilin-type N-terminal cleavage/methylation domain-containing protein [Candidatus Uhrbacteria bacterium]|nr:prepilin-type N-terminal cleavage/methylation domain-containing protein [Candidatus Uhrbacteria bacterium]